jgi:hypothetical protein
VLNPNPANAQENFLTLNNSLDGFYFIRIVFAGADVLGVEVQSTYDRRLLIYSPLNIPDALYTPYVGRSSGGTFGATAKVFDRYIRRYEVIVPFIYTSVFFLANSTTNATVAFDVNYPLPPFQIWRAYAPFVKFQWSLAVGGNSLHMNSTKDGLYDFTILRLPADFRNLTLLPLAATAGAPLPTITLEPAFAKGVLSYSAVVPLVVGAVQLQAFFDTIGTATAYGANAQTASLVDGVASVAFPLLPASLNQFQIDSLQDGVYYLNVTRLPADIQGLNITALDGNNIPTETSLVPLFTDGQYNYTVTVPCQYCSALARSISLALAFATRFRDSLSRARLASAAVSRDRSGPRPSD